MSDKYKQQARKDRRWPPLLVAAAVLALAVLAVLFLLPKPAPAAPEGPAETQAASPSPGADLSAEPRPTASPEPQRIEELTAQISESNPELTLPEESDFLAQPEQRIALSPGGWGVPRYLAPAKDAEYGPERIYNGSVVTVLARSEGFALVLTEDGDYFWTLDGEMAGSETEPYPVSGLGEPVRLVLYSEGSDISAYYEPYHLFPRHWRLPSGTVVLAYNTVEDRTWVVAGELNGWVDSVFLWGYEFGDGKEPIDLEEGSFFARTLSLDSSPDLDVLTFELLRCVGVGENGPVCEGTGLNYQLELAKDCKYSVAAGAEVRELASFSRLIENYGYGSVVILTLKDMRIVAMQQVEY